MKLSKLNTKLFKINMKSNENDYELATYKQLSFWVTRDQKANIVKAMRKNQTCMLELNNNELNNVESVQWKGF